MSRLPARRIVVCLVFAAFLLLPWAASAEPRPASPGFLPRFWTLLTSLWPDAGCILDPDGLCKGPALPASLDEGCILDPSGGCKGSH